MYRFTFIARTLTLASAMLLSGAGAPAQVAAPDAGAARVGQDLACPHSGNCINSLSDGGLAPLRFTGSALQAKAALLATLANLPEARIVAEDENAIEVIFTTPIGFKDQVIFRIDGAARRIDYRSRSLVGLYDFGKNRSRMLDFAASFAKQADR
jgi:uncharacterized protein (DUF1499 family)